MRISRRVLLLLLACTPLLGCGTDRAGVPDANDARPPNIVLIVADDLGYGDLGSYGQARIRTPRLDRMAAEGMRFTQFYAGSTVCAPSRAVLMTGQHTGHTPIKGNVEVRPMGQAPLPDSSVTAAEVLHDVGYATALTGKWGLGGPGSEGIPNNQGFDHFFGYLCQRHAHNYYPEFLFRNRERVPLEGNVLPEPKREDGAGQAIRKAVYSHDRIADEALSFIRDNRDRPFFLFMALTIPHANNEAGDEGMEVPDLGAYAETDWPDPQKGHAAMITRMDTDVGRVLDALEELGIAEHTLVLFTSDNGPHREGGNDPAFNDSNGPLRGIKRDLYEGGIRVPLIAWWPGRVAAGTVSEHVGAFWDFVPTFADLAGAEPPAGVDGISMAPALLGKGEQPGHEYLYWTFRDQEAVRMGDWKGVRSGNDSLELYNLERDLGETADVAGDHPDVVAEIDAVMARFDDTESE